VWRTGLGRCYGPVVRQTAKWWVYKIFAVFSHLHICVIVT
jgi:hypothetical protein